MAPVEWQPRYFTRFVKGLGTNMQTAEVITDAGRAYLKAMRHDSSHHQLACELVGNRLAQWFGLPVPEFSILRLSDEDEIPMDDRESAVPGPAFVSRALRAHVWGGQQEILEQIANIEDVSKIVVFDTWTLNCDRHVRLGRGGTERDGFVQNPNYRNLMFTRIEHSSGYRLIPIDHAHCFTCGRELKKAVANIGSVRCTNVYGLFQGFVPYVKLPHVESALAKLSSLERAAVEAIVHSIPTEWDVSSEVRKALISLICDRATYVVGSFKSLVIPYCSFQEEISLEGLSNE